MAACLTGRHPPKLDMLSAAVSGLEENVFTSQGPKTYVD